MKYVKKTAAFLLAFALISALAACGDPSAQTEDAQAAVDPVESAEDARAAEAVEADSVETNSTEAGSTQAEVPEDAQGGADHDDRGGRCLRGGRRAAGERR